MDAKSRYALDSDRTVEQLSQRLKFRYARRDLRETKSVDSAAFYICVFLSQQQNCAGDENLTYKAE